MKLAAAIALSICTIFLWVHCMIYFCASFACCLRPWIHPAIVSANWCLDFFFLNKSECLQLAMCFEDKQKQDDHTKIVSLVPLLNLVSLSKSCITVYGDAFCFALGPAAPDWKAKGSGIGAFSEFTCRLCVASFWLHVCLNPFVEESELGDLKQQVVHAAPVEPAGDVIAPKTEQGVSCIKFRIVLKFLHEPLMYFWNFWTFAVWILGWWRRLESLWGFHVSVEKWSVGCMFCFCFKNLIRLLFRSFRNSSWRKMRRSRPWKKELLVRKLFKWVLCSMLVNWLYHMHFHV